jgi:hypothetical protein
MEIELIDPPEQSAAPATLPDRPCTAESAECTCPDFCERDHDND